MTRFENAAFSERLKDLGDTAESAFEQWAAKNDVIFERIGFLRPAFKKFYKFNSMLRLMPDYACEGKQSVLVEVKGCGKEGLKIKKETLNALAFWDAIQTVHVFVFNSAKPKRYAFLSVEQLNDLIDFSEVHAFSDGKEFYIITNDNIEWESWE